MVSEKLKSFPFEIAYLSSPICFPFVATSDWSTVVASSSLRDMDSSLLEPPLLLFGIFDRLSTFLANKNGSERNCSKGITN